MLTLHAFPPSPRAFKVLAVAHHLGCDYALKHVDLFQGEQRRESFAAMNPNRRMPVLEEDGFTLWESNAIIEYLAMRERNEELLPTAPRARADVARWLFWESTSWDPACLTLIYEHFVKGALGRGAPDPAEVAKGGERFRAVAEILDGQLDRHAFVCGERLTLADFALGSDLTLAVPGRLPLEGYPRIRRWYAAIEALPAWQRTRAMQRPAETVRV